MIIRFLFIFILVPILDGSLLGQFNEITEIAGVNNVNENTYDGNGCSFVDFNQDGLDDISLCNGNGSPLFYVNQGDNTFISVDMGITNTSATQAKMILWADYDNDCDKDLLLTYTGSPVQLWKNDGDMSFTEVAAASGLSSDYVNYFGASWGDINNDGCLDLFLCKYVQNIFTSGAEWHSDLYLNNCDGNFSDITNYANADIGLKATFQSVFFDYDHDGFQDIYIIIDRYIYRNVLLHNNGDLTFTDMSEESGLDVLIDAMTVTVDDYDNDADMDIYITNGSEGNLLMKNNGNGTWTDAAQNAGVEVNQICWGSLWLDYDNDTWQDLFVGTTVTPYTAYQNYFYINNQDGTFSEGMDITGITGDLDPTFSCAMGDINNDGYYDYVTQNNDPAASSLWLNDGGTNNWLSMECTGTVSNHDGIGTWIECYAGGNEYVRYTHCGENFIGQNSRREIFGLGNYGTVDSLKVYWLSGIVETYYDVPVNQHLNLTEGFTLAENAISFTYEGDAAFCAGDSLVLDAGEFESYLWSTGEDTQQITIYEPGNYSVQVLDQCGREYISLPAAFTTLEAIEATASGQDPTCPGAGDGEAYASIAEGEFTSLEWNTSETDAALTDLFPGFYSFTYTDANGCAGQSNLIELTDPEPLAAELDLSHVSCSGYSDGSVTWVLSGGTPEYAAEVTGASADALPAGDFVLLVIDANLCELSFPFTISEPDPLIIILETTEEFENGPKGTAAASVTGGTPPYTISWSTGATEIWSVEDLDAGFYSVLITDSAGCSEEYPFDIDYITGVGEYSTSTLMIYPNPAENSLFIQFAGIGESEIYVSDYTGRKVWCPISIAGNEANLDLTGLPTGWYVLHLSSAGHMFNQPFSHTAP